MSGINPAELVEKTSAMVKVIDETLNGDAKAPHQPFGFIFATTEMGQLDINYTSNIDPQSAVRLLQFLADKVERAIQ